MLSFEPSLWLNTSVKRLARREGREVREVDAIILLDLVVVGLVTEGEGEHALLLQVGLVDAGEALHQHSAYAQVARLHGGVFAA